MNSLNVVASRARTPASRRYARTRNVGWPPGPIMSVNGGDTNHNLSHWTARSSPFRPDHGLRSSTTRRHSGDSDPDPQFLGRVRPTAGGQISIVTKSGTNTFHGTAWEFHRFGLEHAQLLLEGRRIEKTGAGAEQAAPAPPAHHRRQAVLVRLVSAALGPRRGRIESDDRAENARRAGDFTALSTPLRNPVDPLTNTPFTDSSGAPCVARHRRRRLRRPGCERITGRAVPASVPARS